MAVTLSYLSHYWLMFGLCVFFKEIHHFLLYFDKNEDLRLSVPHGIFWYGNSHPWEWLP